MEASPRMSPFARAVSYLLIGISMAGMGVAIAIAVFEHTLPEPTWFKLKQTVFVAGNIGTEFVPLPVLEVLPVLFPDRFPKPEFDDKTQSYKGGWIEKYGFIERRGADEPTFPKTEPELAELLKTDKRHQAFPVGFTFSQYRSFSPDASPVTFVGLACAGCHSNRFPDHGPDGKIVYGAGNTRLDLAAFFESFRATLLDKKPLPGLSPDQTKPYSITEQADLTPDQLEYVLTMSSIRQARKVSSLEPMSIAEEAMVFIWLTGAHSSAETLKMRDDLPGDMSRLRTPAFNPGGPGRTEPFVTLDHIMFGLPAKQNHGYSKIPAVFHEDYRKWAQFDGSVQQPRTRSGLAAMTAGGSVNNLSGMGVARNILAAADYTVDELVGPKWNDFFADAEKPAQSGDNADPNDKELTSLNELQQKGRAFYREKCASCHGQPMASDPSKWDTSFAEYGKIVPTIDPFKFKPEQWPDYWYVFKSREEWQKQTVDPQRVEFRDGSRIPFVLYTYFERSFPQKITGEYFPLRHPLATERSLIRNSGGYINASLDSLFIRAPYLHNGSVPTLEELLNLKDRPATFLRGLNLYDTKNVGLIVPEAGPDGKLPDPTEEVYFPMETSQPGNWNTGHNYPWTRDEVKQNPGWETDLRALLEYLKTL